MGASGTGIFENDDAMDFVADLEDAEEGEVAERLRSVMQGVLQDEEVESWSMCEALAAAALTIAWADLGLLEDEPDAPERWPFVDAPRPLDLLDLAQQVLRRAADPGGNEWFDLWAEVGAEPELLHDLERWTVAADGQVR